MFINLLTYYMCMIVGVIIVLLTVSGVYHHVLGCHKLPVNYGETMTLQKCVSLAIVRTSTEEKTR